MAQREQQLLQLLPAQQHPGVALLVLLLVEPSRWTVAMQLRQQMQHAG
jgi:hypothetical protein